MSIFRSIHKIGPLHNKLLLIISEFAFRGLGSLLCLVLCRCMSLLYSKICDRDLGRPSFTNSYTKCCIYISRKSLNFIILRCLKSGDEASLYFAPVMARMAFFCTTSSFFICFCMISIPPESNAIYYVRMYKTIVQHFQGFFR